ncbi:MAG: hypothetical protein ABSB49_03265 [Polyangia bacterium]
MDDPELMRGAQAMRDLLDDVDGFEKRQPVNASQAIFEAFPLEVARRHEDRSVRGRTEVRHVDNVGVMDAAGGFGLNEKPLDRILLPAAVFVQHLDGHRLVAHQVPCPVDDSNPTFTNGTFDLVVLQSYCRASRAVGWNVDRRVRGRIFALRLPEPC